MHLTLKGWLERKWSVLIWRGLVGLQAQAVDTWHWAAKELKCPCYYFPIYKKTLDWSSVMTELSLPQRVTKTTGEGRGCFSL